MFLFPHYLAVPKDYPVRGNITQESNSHHPHHVENSLTLKNSPKRKSLSSISLAGYEVKWYVDLLQET